MTNIDTAVIKESFRQDYQITFRSFNVVGSEVQDTYRQLICNASFSKWQPSKMKTASSSD